MFVDWGWRITPWRKSSELFFFRTDSLEPWIGCGMPGIILKLDLGILILGSSNLVLLQGNLLFGGFFLERLPSGKLTWQWKMDLLKMYFLLKMGIFHCHVSLLEGIGLGYLASLFWTVQIRESKPRGLSWHHSKNVPGKHTGNHGKAMRQGNSFSLLYTPFLFRCKIHQEMGYIFCPVLEVFWTDHPNVPLTGNQGLEEKQLEWFISTNYCTVAELAWNALYSFVIQKGFPPKKNRSNNISIFCHP